MLTSFSNYFFYIVHLYFYPLENYILITLILQQGFELCFWLFILYIIHRKLYFQMVLAFMWDYLISEFLFLMVAVPDA